MAEDGSAATPAASGNGSAVAPEAPGGGSATAPAVSPLKRPKHVPPSGCDSVASSPYEKGLPNLSAKYSAAPPPFGAAPPSAPAAATATAAAATAPLPYPVVKADVEVASNVDPTGALLAEAEAVAGEYATPVENGPFQHDGAVKVEAMIASPSKLVDLGGEFQTVSSEAEAEELITPMLVDGGSKAPSTDKDKQEEEEAIPGEHVDVEGEEEEEEDDELLLAEQKARVGRNEDDKQVGTRGCLPPMDTQTGVGGSSSNMSSKRSSNSSNSSSNKKNKTRLRSDDGDKGQAGAGAGTLQAQVGPVAEDGQQKQEKPEKTIIKVSFRDATGQKIFFKLSPSVTVLTLKRALGTQYGVSHFAFRLILDGKTLKDVDQTFEHYGVKDGDQLDVMIEQSGGKPVILLYPSEPLDATVTLELSPLWSFSALYPRPPPNKLQQASFTEATVAGSQKCEWSVHASPDGSLQDLSTGKPYPYLFWEAVSTDGAVTRSFGLDETRSFCVAGHATGVFLDGALQRLGLNARERCDMITYWLAQLESSAFSVIYFVETERYEQAARLTIVPAPDVTIRVFMAFRGVNTYDAGLDTAKVEDLQAPDRKGFVAIEWGGMNLDGRVSH